MNEYEITIQIEGRTEITKTITAKDEKEAMKYALKHPERDIEFYELDFSWSTVKSCKPVSND